MKVTSNLQERLMGETVVYSPIMSPHTYTHPGLEEDNDEDNIAYVDQFTEQLIKESEVCMYVWYV